jgi:xylose isomerase
LEQWRRERYSSFDKGMGADFANGKLKLMDLRQYALEQGEPSPRSGRQEAYENLYNQHLLAK